MPPQASTGVPPWHLTPCLLEAALLAFSISVCALCMYCIECRRLFACGDMESNCYLSFYFWPGGTWPISVAFGTFREKLNNGRILITRPRGRAQAACRKRCLNSTANRRYLDLSGESNKGPEALGDRQNLKSFLKLFHIRNCSII